MIFKEIGQLDADEIHNCEQLQSFLFVLLAFQNLNELHWYGVNSKRLDFNKVTFLGSAGNRNHGVGLLLDRRIQYVL